MDSHTVISIVAALENDASVIDHFLDHLSQQLSTHYRFFEIILVDDGSTDDTRRILEKKMKEVQRVRYMRLSRPFGRDVALSAGIESAVGDYVVTMNPTCDPVECIHDLVAKCRTTGGIVHGVATNLSERSVFREVFGNLFRKYCKKHLGVELRRGAEDFRVMSRQAVNALLQVRVHSRYLRVLTLTLGYQHDFFDYAMKERSDVSSSGLFVAEVSTAVDLLAANTRHPLRVVTLAGIAGAAINFAYAVYVLAIFLLKQNVAEGWTTQSMQLSGMFFFLCLILAVMSEYVGAILGEVRSRPLYFISHEANSSVLLEDTVQSSIVRESNENPEL